MVATIRAHGEGLGWGNIGHRLNWGNADGHGVALGDALGIEVGLDGTDHANEFAGNHAGGRIEDRRKGREGISHGMRLSALKRAVV